MASREQQLFHTIMHLLFETLAPTGPGVAGT